MQLVHHPISGSFMASLTSTTVSFDELSNGTRVSLTQGMRVKGFGLKSTIRRWVMRRGSFMVEATLDRLISLVEHDGPRTTRQA
jgi:hypothetical protein